MSSNRAWVIALIAAVLLVGMLAFARGAANRHGIQVGVRDTYSTGQTG